MRVLRRCLAGATLAATLAVPVHGQRSPTRVVLFIGDGVGAAYWTAARLAADALAVERMPVGGLVDVRGTSGPITDSAASATAYATGVRTYNGAIGVGPDTLPRRTLLEIAEERGLATGLVATSSLTHATPASFAAHVPSRYMHAAIAEEMASRPIEVLLGGGRGFFDGSLRRDRRNLLPELRRRYAYVETAGQLRALALDTTRSILGLFGRDRMPPAGTRAPSLPEMTRIALAVLDRNPAGFFLMVEGSQPDWRGHENRSFESVAAEVLDFDAAIGVVLDYRERRPETLVVVVADHETGGLAIDVDPDARLRARYVSDGHTAELVPLFAAGPGAERFGGLTTNVRVGELLLVAVGRATAR